MTSARWPYPQTRTVDATEEAAGVQFPDPYRWLEDDTEEVRRWQEQQTAVASSYSHDWPHYDKLRTLVELHTTQRFGVPRYAGGAWFREETPATSTYPQVIMAETPYGAGRVLVDLADYQDGEDHPFLSWISPSPDGSTLAIGVCTDGSEQNTIRLIDVATSKELPGAPTQLLYDGWTGGAHWLPDSSGFYFTALQGSVEDFQQAVFLHRLGQPAPTEPENIPGSDTSRHDYTLVQVSRDGHWAIAVSRMMNPIPAAVRDLRDAASSWRPFIIDIDATVAGHVLDDAYVAITDYEAPRGRLVRIPLDSPTPNDPSTWQELVPASEAVLRTLVPVGDHFYITEFADTYAKVRIFRHDGSSAGIVALPENGALDEPPFPMMALVPRGHPDTFVFRFSSLTSSWATFQHHPGEGAVEQLRGPTAVLDGAVVEDHWATSADGTRIPYHTVRLSKTDGSKAQPTLIYAYGGFNAPWIPQYPSAMAAFVEAGGVFVHAHLRGGSEFGRQWWEGGRLKNKQNCFDDLYAVAEDMISRGQTNPDLLAVTGGSNGGLLCGVAITQRPDLWKAVVPRVPVLDLIGDLRSPYAAESTRLEYADPDDPAEITRLSRFSPYHLIRPGENYPAVFIEAGATDPRCLPWHATKFAARLQAAQSGDAPILVHVWENAGHGWATEVSLEHEQETEWLAFLLKTLGMSL